MQIRPHLVKAAQYDALINRFSLSIPYERSDRILSRASQQPARKREEERPKPASRGPANNASLTRGLSRRFIASLSSISKIRPFLCRFCSRDVSRKHNGSSFAFSLSLRLEYFQSKISSPLSRLWRIAHVRRDISTSDVAVRYCSSVFFQDQENCAEEELAR